MKKALAILAFLAVAGYLIFSASYFKDKPGEDSCNQLDVVVSNAASNQFIDTEQIKKGIKKSQVNPINRLIADINTIEIEELVLKNRHIKKAEVYITNKNDLRIVIEERKPIIRIIPDVGESYYIDDDAEIMPLSKRYTAYLPIATGNIKESFAKEELYKFALFLHDSEFWNAQVEQIMVASNNDISFIPRVGDQTIIVGSTDDLEQKLDKLMNFYQDGLNRIGWNKYSSINLKYDKQVVCTKQ